MRLLNVRIIAASNRNLREEVRRGRFREDLFFRLDVTPLLIPPLRQRRDDPHLLVAYFLRQFGEARERNFRVAPKLMRRFETYAWHDNVRELRNFVEYGVCFCYGGLLTPELMAPSFRSGASGKKTCRGIPGRPRHPGLRRRRNSCGNCCIISVAIRKGSGRWRATWA